MSQEKQAEEKFDCDGPYCSPLYDGTGRTACNDCPLCNEREWDEMEWDGREGKNGKA